MAKILAVVVKDQASLPAAAKLVERLTITKPLVISVDEETRTLAHNAVQWPILNAFADQLLWPINGAMTKITADDWKNILTSAYRQETVRVAQGLDGGMVLLGHKTREFKASEWADWMAFLESVAADRDVKIPMSKKQAAMYGK